MLAVATGLMLIFAASLPGSVAAQSASQARTDTRLWYQAYSDGTAAIQRKDWQAAVDSLEAAKRAHPAVGRRVTFYGDIVRPFDPDYYLGTAYLNLKRFADADAAFQRVRDAKLIVPGDPEYSAFNRDATAAVFEHQMANAEAALRGKDYGKAQQAAAIARNTGVDSARVDDLTRRISSAQAIVQTAPVGGAPASSSTNTPVQGPVNAPPVQGPVNAPPVQGPVNAPPVQGPVNAPPPQVAVNVPPVGRGSPPPPASSAGAAAPITRLPAATRTPPVAPPKLPAGPARPNDEQIAIETFLSGDYEAASRLWTAIAQRTPSPRTHFYLACSDVALVLTGKANPALLKDARAELAQAGPLTQFTADERFVSPRILQTLAAQR
jgi:tetratricopeptide (TPR) repeat protein